MKEKKLRQANIKKILCMPILNHKLTKSNDTMFSHLHFGNALKETV